MKTSLTTRLASCAAALVITFTTVQALAAYGLQPLADTMVVSACMFR
jgi:hypothetical protein